MRTCAPLGKLVSRSVKSPEYVTSLPGAPDEKYTLIQFYTSFENKKEADGAWGVSRYLIG